MPAGDGENTIFEQTFLTITDRITKAIIGSLTGSLAYPVSTNVNPQDTTIINYPVDTATGVFTGATFLEITTTYSGTSSIRITS